MNLNDPFISSLIPLILLFGIFYFLIIRPQQQRMKAHQAMVAAVKRGDTVVTAGGLIGKVAKVKDDGELHGRDRRQCSGPGAQEHADRSASEGRAKRRVGHRR